MDIEKNMEYIWLNALNLMFGKESDGNNQNRIPVFYITYWLVYLLFFSIQRFFAKQFVLTSIGLVTAHGFAESLITNLIYLPEVIISTHFVVSFLLPRYYFRGEFRKFYFLLSVTIIIYPFLPYLVRTFVVEKVYPLSEEYTFYNYFAAMLIYVFGMAPLAWVQIASHLRTETAILQKIDKDRLEALLKLKEAELKLLKSQLHPHFLFNTLNNLYSLALEKSDRAPDLIIRLSDMLSYIIYDCKSEMVPLSKDIDFIKNYIEVQKVRFDNCNISITIKGETENKVIAPMILHTFIDNSFKHGVERDSGDSWIKIALNSSDDTLFLTVINSIVNDLYAEQDNEGIGITNTRKRLEMIYRDKHQLVLQKTHNKFAVFLKMKL